MKTEENGPQPVKLVETITILNVASPLPKQLITALGYAAAPHWTADCKLYILNCALQDAQILCAASGTGEFLWGKPGAPLGRYRLLRDDAAYMGLVPDEVLPADLSDRAPMIYNRQELQLALDEKRTFLSRGQHRRTAAGGQ